MPRIVHLEEKFIIRFVHQFSDSDITTEVTKALSLQKSASTLLMSAADKTLPKPGAQT